MKIVAYLYSDPLANARIDPTIWGWEVADIYQDLDPARPQLQRLLQSGKTTPIDYLLLRNLAELGDTVEGISDRLTHLEALGVTIIAIEQDYTSAQADRTPQQLLPLLNQIQADQRRRRICQGHAQNRLKALPPPGRAPYGYRRGKDRYALDRRTAPVVKDFFEHFLLYGSLRGAVRHLEKQHNKKIAISTGRKWLTHPVYRGDLVYQDDQVLGGTHVPIVSRDEAAQVDRLLRRNRGLAPRAASAPRSLSGLVVCGECHSPMTVSRVTTPRQSGEYLYLRPKSCPRRPKCSALAYQQVLDQTITRICQDLPQAVAGISIAGGGGIKDTLDAAIASKQRVLQQLPALVTDQVLDLQTAELRAYRLRTEIAAIKTQLSQLPPENLKKIAQTISISQFWLDLSESERRFYFREFIRQIVLQRQGQAWSLSLRFIF